jgi:hypothetical protein
MCYLIFNVIISFLTTKNLKKKQTVFENKSLFFKLIGNKSIAKILSQ